MFEQLNGHLRLKWLNDIANVDIETNWKNIFLSRREKGSAQEKDREGGGGLWQRKIE